MDFPSYVRRVASNWKLLGAAVVPATASWIVNLAPPWPDESGTASYAFAALLSLVGILVPYAFHTIRNRAVPILIAALLSCCLMVTYATSWSLWIGKANQRNGGSVVERRFVKGDRIVLALTGTTENNLLRDNGYRVEDVYTPMSLVYTRLWVLFSFAGTFFFLTITVAFAALPKSRARA